MLHQTRNNDNEVLVVVSFLLCIYLLQSPVHMRLVSRFVDTKLVLFRPNAGIVAKVLLLNSANIWSIKNSYFLFSR